MPAGYTTDSRVFGNARSVLLVRPDNLGDVVLFSGCLKHVRQIFPRARISLCVKEYARGFVQHCPHIDRVVSYEKMERRVLRSPLLRTIACLRGGWRLREFLRRRARSLFGWLYGADVVALCPRSPLEAHHRVVGRIAAGYRFSIFGDGTNVGPETEEKYRAAYDGILLCAPDDGLHEIETNRCLLAHFGYEVSQADMLPEVWESEADRRAATDLLGADSEGGAVIGVSPGASAPSGKILPPHWYGEVFRGMPTDHTKIVLFGPRREAGLCEDVCRSIQESGVSARVEDYAGKTGIGSLAACLRHCNCLLSVDNACLHLGTTVGIRTVGVVGGGHWGRFFPWGDEAKSTVLTHRLDCFRCNWRCRQGGFRCVQDVPPEEARRAILYHLGRDA